LSIFYFPSSFTHLFPVLFLFSFSIPPPRSGVAPTFIGSLFAPVSRSCRIPSLCREKSFFTYGLHPDPLKKGGPFRSLSPLSSPDVNLPIVSPDSRPLPWEESDPFN